MKKISLTYLRFQWIRLLGGWLNPDLLYRLLLPVAVIRAICNRRPARLSLPESLGRGTIVTGDFRSRLKYFQNAALGFFPEKLKDQAWFKRCSFSGLEPLRECQRLGRPAILVCCHFGPAFLLSRWLQAAGFKSATLVGDKTETRSCLNRLKDQVTLFPEIPRTFFADQLRELSAFLAAGNVLVIAMDSPKGKHIEIPIDEETCFRIATGPLRLAATHGARLLPCVILNDGPWRFRLELGRPVPDIFPGKAWDVEAAGKHLLDELLPYFRTTPENCSKMLLDCFVSQPKA